MKVCFKCLQLKSLDNFYKHSKNSDGYLGKCKECTKSDSKIRLIKLRVDKDFVEKERLRGRNKYYRLNYKNNSKLSPERRREIRREHDKKFPEKVLARKSTEIYFDKKKGYNLHHWSYNTEHWNDIIELSVKDHHRVHRYLVYDCDSKFYKTIEGEILDSKEKHLEYISNLPF